MNKGGVLVVDNFLEQKWEIVGKSGKIFLILPTGKVPERKTEMVKFIGEYASKLDEKGRVVVPAAFKNLVAKHIGEGEISFVIKKDLFANCLNMFTYEQWDQESEQVRSRLNLYKEEHARWYREYTMDRALVTLDGKVGRIIIPKNLLAKIGADKEIVFSGSDFKIEIWAKENFGKDRMSEEEFTNLTEKLLG